MKMDIEPEIVEVDELKLAGPAVVFKGESGKEDDKESDKLWGQTGYYGRVTSNEPPRSKLRGIES